ncbi:odorant receptor 2a-like [Zophobas morio]|uniref:odorant receptor 2a-like n=1 Tax=Zophobas morio TaxID=2755281 RepID=UPI00308298D3
MDDVNNKIIICRSTRKYLRYILLWPYPHEELKSGNYYTIQIGVYIFVTSITSLSILIHLIITTAKNLEVPVMEDVTVLASITGIYYMTFIYVKNQPKLANLLREMSNFQNFGKPTNFDQKERNLSLLSKAVFVYLAICVTQYNALKFNKKEECEERNKNQGLRENCGFITQLWTPFSTQNFVVYYSLYAYVFLSMQLLMKPNMLLTYHAFEITEHLILRIEHLNQMFYECFDNVDYNCCRSRLSKCILYHIHILNLAKSLDECFSNGMLTHITITAIICACIGKQFTEGDHLCAVIHFSGWIFTLAFACFSGQQLINASESIPSAIWFSKWYEVDIKLQREVLFVLARSQKTFYLTAGPFNVLCFPLLVSVVKMSYSMLCLLTK